jgi:hypothetical protein
LLSWLAQPIIQLCCCRKQKHQARNSAKVIEAYDHHVDDDDDATCNCQHSSAAVGKVSNQWKNTVNSELSFGLSYTNFEGFFLVGLGMITNHCWSVPCSGLASGLVAGNQTGRT